MQFLYSIGSQIRITRDHLTATDETYHGPNCLWCRISRRSTTPTAPRPLTYRTGNELHSSTLGSKETRNPKKAILCVLDSSVDGSVHQQVELCMRSLFVNKIMRIGTHNGMSKTKRNVSQAAAWLARDVEERQLFFAWFIGQDPTLTFSSIREVDSALSSLPLSSAVHLVFDGIAETGVTHSFGWVHTYNPVSERVVTVKNPHFVASYPCKHIWCWHTKAQAGPLTRVLCEGNDSLEKRRRHLGTLFRSVAARLWARSHLTLFLYSNIPDGLARTFFGMHQ